MERAEVLNDLSDAIRAVSNLIDSADQRGVLIGGVAVALIGEPRATRDVDAMILQGNRSIEQLLQMASRQGLVSRVEDPFEFARRNRILLLTHLATGIGVDISLGALPFEEEMVAEAKHIRMDGFTVRVPKVEHLILMKAFAGRGRDIADIGYLIERYPDYDRDWVTRGLAELADLVERPELVEQFESLLRDLR